MALNIYTDAVREFDATLADIRAYATFVGAANYLRPRVAKMVDYNSLDRLHSDALNGFVSQKEYRVEVGFNGLMVSLTGTFEHFVRRLIRDGVIKINESYDKFETLSGVLREQNLLRSGYALATITEPRDEVTYDYEQLCKNLGTCRTDGGKLLLNADAFTVGITNINPQRINDLLKRVGVTIDWDVFGRDTDLQRLFGETKARATRTALENWLKNFITRRNRIAHSDGSGIQTSETDINEAIDILAAFAPILAGAVGDGLTKIYR